MFSESNFGIAETIIPNLNQNWWLIFCIGDCCNETSWCYTNCSWIYVPIIKNSFYNQHMTVNNNIIGQENKSFSSIQNHHMNETPTYTIESFTTSMLNSNSMTPIVWPITIGIKLTQNKNYTWANNFTWDKKQPIMLPLFKKLICGCIFCAVVCHNYCLNENL